MRVSTRRAQDPRIPLIEGMIDLIQSGYYATETHDGGKVNFLYISRPEKGNYKDTIKISTQHGPRWEPALVRYPDEQWILTHRDALDFLMLVLADPKGCALRYGKLGHCCKCNTELTDMRSRHYGIGPECEKKYNDAPLIIALVDEENDGKDFDRLVMEGVLER